MKYFGLVWNEHWWFFNACGSCMNINHCPFCLLFFGGLNPLVLLLHRDYYTTLLSLDVAYLLFICIFFIFKHPLRFACSCGCVCVCSGTSARGNRGYVSVSLFSPHSHVPLCQISGHTQWNGQPGLRRRWHGAEVRRTCVHWHQRSHITIWVLLYQPNSIYSTIHKFGVSKKK